MELPHLVLAFPCAQLSEPRSWEACLYDAAYDLQQRRWRYKVFGRWSYKVFVSWVRQLGDDDGEDEEFENMRPRTSFHVYSSTTNSWTVLAAALEPLELETQLVETQLAESLPPVYLLEYVVGQGRTLHIYAKGFIGVDADEGCVDVMRFSKEGRVIATLPVVQGLPEWRNGKVWPILLDASLTSFCVSPDCTIYRCTWLQWTKITSLPPDIRAKMGLSSPHEADGLH